MKKNLIALAILAASGAASAQSSVTLYGIADVWFGGVKVNSTTNAVVQSGGVSASRFGFKGTEDLGGGLKANFVLEQGFNMDDGTAGTPGQSFSRESYVGFSSAYGELRLGKTMSPFDDINPLTISAFESQLAPTALGTWRSTGYNANPANTIYYATPSYSGFSGAASYSLGEDKNTIAGNNKPGRTTSFNVKYAGGPVYVGFAYQAEKTAGAPVTQKFLRVNGSYDFGMVKLLADYGRVDDVNNVNGDKTTEWHIGADVPVSSALTLSGGYARSKDNVAAGIASGAFTGSKRTGFGFAANYALSKRTSVYGGLHLGKDNATPTNKVNAYAVGVRHTF